MPAQNKLSNRNIHCKIVIILNYSYNKKKNLSPKSENWRKQYLLMKSERDNLQKENKQYNFYDVII